MDATTWDVMRVTAIEPSAIDVHNLTVAGQPRGWFASHLTAASWLVRPPLDHQGSLVDCSSAGAWGSPSRMAEGSEKTA